MEINKTESRKLLAIASGRVSTAKQSLHDLDTVINDLMIKRSRAKDQLENAEIAYEEALKILERD